MSPYVYFKLHIFYIVIIPSITAIIPLTSLSLQAFGSTTITCEAQGGPRLIIRWYKANQLVLSGQIGNTSLSYDIPSANVTDNGDYTCVASIDDYEVNSTSINILGKQWSLIIFN